MWIEREIEKTLKLHAATRPATILTGGRQTGKTSLLQRLYPGIRYVSLDIPRIAEEAENSGESFLETNSPPLILDEVQYAPGVFRYIKTDIDAHRNENLRYLITGSQKFSLMQGVTESLAGRAGIIELYSLSASEMESFHGIKADKKTILRWIYTGGYPEIHASDLDPERYYGDFIATYLERDVRQALQVKNLRDFDLFLRLAAVRTGQLLSMNSFASDLGVSPNTVRSWLSVLEASGIIHLLEPYFDNMGKRIVKTPKLYFVDTGIAAYLAGFRSPEEMEKSQLIGAFFESYVMGQFIRYYSNRCRKTPIYFLRDHHGHEIDFVVSVGNKLKLYECKWSENPESGLPGFSYADRSFSDRIISKSIIIPVRGYRKKDGLIIEDCVGLKSLEESI